jgi:hypothetical protein
MQLVKSIPICPDFGTRTDFSLDNARFVVAYRPVFIRRDVVGGSLPSGVKRLDRRMVMRTAAILFASLIAFEFLYGQAPKGTAKIALEAPPAVAAGQQATANIRLLDASGRPSAADADIRLRVDAFGAVVDHQNVTIPKGATSAQVAVSREKPGISDIRVEQTDAPAGGFKASAQISFSPSDAYTPVRPLTLWLSVQSTTKLKAGIETAKIIVRYIDSHKVSIPAPQEFLVAFPGLADKMSPYPLRIPSGAPFGEASLANNRAEIIPLNPVPSPHSL